MTTRKGNEKINMRTKKKNTEVPEETPAREDMIKCNLQIISFCFFCITAFT